MDFSLILQYSLIGIMVGGACYYLYKLIADSFSSKNRKKGDFGCDKDCGH